MSTNPHLHGARHARTAAFAVQRHRDCRAEVGKNSLPSAGVDKTRVEVDLVAALESLSGKAEQD